MAEKIRSFIAIELEDENHRALRDLQARFQRELAAEKNARSTTVRWVAPENIHLTLKFLGDVDAAAMPALQRAVADACAGVAPFTLTLRGTGAFPDTRRPNVLWVGIEGQVERATQLAQRIEDACAALGFAREERPFSPHLTLGRVKRDIKPNDRSFVGEIVGNAIVGELGQLHVERVSVMKSELQPGGSVYTRLHSIELNV